MELTPRIKSLLRSIYSFIPFKRCGYHLLRKVCVVPHSVYKHLHFRGTFKVSLPDDVSFKIHHYGYQLENALFWEGIEGWEGKSMHLWINLCRDSKYIFDIGANTGLYSLVAKAVNPNAEVYAFEPVEEVYKKLLFNCRINKYSIHCSKLAVSNYDGIGTIYLPPAEHVYSVTVNRNLLQSSGRCEQIQTIKLSSFMDSFGLPQIDLAKIDVETHEVEVLEGMAEYLKSMKTSFLIEILNDEVGVGVERLLGGRGYLFFYLEGVGNGAFAGHQGGRLPRQHSQNRIERVVHLGQRRAGNYFICHEMTARRYELI